MKASSNGCLDIVTLLVQGGAEVNHTDRYNRNALFMAASSGHVEIVKYLIAGGAKVNYKADSISPYKNKTTMVIEALNNRHLKIVKILIKAGADVNHVLTEGWSPLMVAVSQGHINCIKFLIDMQKAKYHVSSTAVGSHGERYELCVREKRWTKKNNVGEPHYCKTEKLSNERHLGCVKLLIESGTDVNRAAKNGWTALMMASLDGYLDILQLLVESGASVNATCNMGWSPLIYAIVGNHYKSAESLLRAGANVNHQAHSPPQSTLEFSLYTGIEGMLKLVILFGHHLQYLRKN